MITKKFQSPTQEEIARYAYFLWESEGRMHGRDLDYWLQAEAHLTANREHEAGLLKTQPEQETQQKNFETLTASAPPAPRTARRRQHRIVREREEVFA